jgi:AcrR family transcriptional regulator
MAEQARSAKTRRRYQLRARAQGMDQTRARITSAAIELHGTIGPVATTMSSVAELAGVTRATLYRHFPNEAALFAACSAEWRSAHPSPDPSEWAEIPNPRDRLMVALPSLYGWYRESEGMRANLLRDVGVLPPAIRDGITAYPSSIADALNAGWPRKSRLRRAAIGHAVDFHTWRSLAHQGLTDTDAATLMTTLIVNLTDQRSV